MTPYATDYAAAPGLCLSSLFAFHCLVRRQFFIVIQSTSLRLRYLHAASAWSLSRPANRARKYVVSPLSTDSVNASALASRRAALFLTDVSCCLAMLSSGYAPTWMIQPVRAKAFEGVTPVMAGVPATWAGTLATWAGTLAGWAGKRTTVAVSAGPKAVAGTVIAV